MASPVLDISPNPVGVVGMGRSALTNIHWETGGNFDGHVRVSVAGGAFQNVAPPAPVGDAKYSITEGINYQFELVRESNMNVLRSVSVTAVNLQQQLTDLAMAGLAISHKINPPQSIVDLDVITDVDSIKVRFTTVVSCSPTVNVEELDGQVIESLSRPPHQPNTRHVFRFGSDLPLPQSSLLRVRIHAPGHKPLLSFAKSDANRSIVVETGSRSGIVRFTYLRVHNDSDEGGSGEFKFFFTAGDADDPPGRVVDLEAPMLRRDVSDHERVDVNEDISFPVCPRRIWVRVEAWEDDMPWFLPFNFMGPFRAAGSRWVGTIMESGDWGDMAEISSIVDVSHPLITNDSNTKAWESFQMDTGPGPVSFTAHGKIELSLNHGRGYHTWARTYRPGAGMGVMTGPSMVLPEGGSNQGTRSMTLLSTDGHSWVYHARTNAKQAHRDVTYEKLAPWPGGSVTPIVDSQGSINLFGLDDRGHVVHWRPRRRRAEGSWEYQGATIKGHVLAVAGKSGHDLFGIDADGRVLHGAIVDSREPHWQFLGDLVVVHIDIVDVPRRGLGVIALTSEGSVWHTSRLPRRKNFTAWSLDREGDVGWFNVAISKKGDGVNMDVVTVDRQLERLAWQEYPESPADSEWTSLGSYDEWDADTNASQQADTSPSASEKDASTNPVHREKIQKK